MSQGLLRGRWRVTDNFGDEWHILFVPATDQQRDGTSLDWQSRSQLEQLVFDGFTHSGAANDHIAGVLLEIYDALTNSRLSSRFPRPTDDPQQVLCDFDRELRHTLVGALMAGEIRIERVARAPWPFLDSPDEPAPEALGPVASTHIYRVLVVDDTGARVAGAALSLVIAGAKQDQTTDGSGKVTVQTMESGGATVTVTNLDALREKLWPQWSKPLADKPPPGDQVTQAVVTQPIAPLNAPCDWLVTLVLARPPIWRVRMVGMVFDADKCFLLPQALDGIRSIVAMHQAHPAAKVLIVGHEGGDEVTGSVDLALGRAKILAGYLTSKSDDWMPWFGADKSQRQRWGLREVQLMLSALKGADGKPFYVGGSAGVMDATTTAALKAFQQASGLAADGKAGADTRTALVTKYMALEDTSLAAGVEPVAHGCTGHQDDTITEDGLQPDDRRLEVLFFDTDIKPAPSGDTSDAGAPEYPAWRARLVETVDFENHGIHVQIVDTAKQPMAFATAHLAGPIQADTTADEHGFVSFWGLVAGAYTLNVTTKTGRPVPPSKITYPTAKTIEGARALPSKGKTGAT